MDIWLSLDRLRAGQRGTVEKIGLTGPLGRRLTDLGLVRGDPGGLPDDGASGISPGL